MYYVYGIIDPTENMIGYVGITSNTPQRRLVQHLRQDDRDARGIKRQWLEGLLENGYMPTVITLQTVDTVQRAQIAEKWWIAHGQMIGWPLRNSNHYVRPTSLDNEKGSGDEFDTGDIAAAEDDEYANGNTFTMFDDDGVTFPLPTNRPPTPAEALALRQLYEQTGSKNEVIRRAYGSKNGAILGYVNQALSEGGAA
jgi:hypothetical protein